VLTDHVRPRNRVGRTSDRELGPVVYATTLCSKPQGFNDRARPQRKRLTMPNEITTGACAPHSVKSAEPAAHVDVYRDVANESNQRQADLRARNLPGFALFAGFRLTLVVLFPMLDQKRAPLYRQRSPLGIG